MCEGERAGLRAFGARPPDHRSAARAPEPGRSTRAGGLARPPARSDISRSQYGIAGPSQRADSCRASERAKKPQTCIWFIQVLRLGEGGQGRPGHTILQLTVVVDSFMNRPLTNSTSMGRGCWIGRNLQRLCTDWDCG